MIVTTTPFVAGNRVVEAKGQVFGLAVRSRGLAGTITAGLRSLVGGEIHEYTELLYLQRVRVWLDPDTGERRYRPDK
jgi:uncharacterized protein YbjQ (UPF0145 family)